MTGWDTSSIVSMVRTAGSEEDKCCSVEIESKWLEASFNPEGRLLFRYGGRIISREKAEVIFGKGKAAQQ